MKTSDIIKAYATLKDARLSKMTCDADRFAVVKAFRKMKKVAEDFESFRSDALEKLKGDEHDQIVTKAQQWQQEEAERKEVTLSVEERKAVNAYFLRYNQSVTDCLREESDTEHDLEASAISEESFQQLVASNDWTMEQIMAVEDALCR